jgi:glycine/sarcosine N-methyltransferase
MRRISLADLPTEIIISAIVSILEAIYFPTFIEKFLQYESYIQYAITLVSAIFTFFFVLGITYAVSTKRSGSLIRLIFDLQRLGKDRKAITAFCAGQIKGLDKKLKDLRTDNGAEFDISLANQYWTLLFQEGKSYDGTDIHIPSVYMKEQGEYLKSHLQLQQRGHIRGSRFLIISKEDLLTDCVCSYPQFKEFVRWHDENDVDLFQVDPYHADNCRIDLGLRSIEVGVWYGKYSLEFKREYDPNSSIITLFLSHKDKKRIGYYDKCSDYIKILKNYATPVKDICDPIIRNPPLPDNPLDDRLSDHWPEYVNCQKRLSSEGEFLTDTIRRKVQFKSIKDIHILDAAAGIGCESLFLSRKGYMVTLNEIVDKLSRIAFSNMNEDEKRKIVRTNYNWRQMGLKYGNNKFDVVLVLGNSLCLIPKNGIRKLCVVQFKKILKPGGILIIDQRNFETILTNVPQILDKKYFYGKFYSGNYMYCGTEVKGWPCKVDGNIVKFAYGSDRDPPYGYLEMHAFRGDDMERLLASAGFKSIEISSDFKSGYDGRAEFFTYVAQKPVD